MDTVIKLYNHNSYLETYGGDVVTTLILFLIAFGITSYATYQSMMLQIKTNWNEHRCNPIYMPFAGIIMPKPGLSTSENTSQNFAYCTRQDTSMVFSIAMMPLEFGMFLVIEFIDACIDAIMALMMFIQWLKDQMGGMIESLYDQILHFIIPVIEITVHIRDTLAKINGVIVTSLFLTMNIYNTTVSGIINIMTILTDLLIALISVVVAMMIFALILLITPAFPLGISVYATATVVLASILIPTVIIYTLMQVFTSAVMQGQAPDPPSLP